MAPKELQFSFAKTLRLLKNEQFRAVISLRKRASDGLLTVFAAPNGLDFARVGISVSKSVGNAVRRNLIKRLVREAFRQNKERIRTGCDYVVTAGPKASGPLDFEMVRNSLVTLADVSVKK